MSLLHRVETLEEQVRLLRIFPTGWVTIPLAEFLLAGWNEHIEIFGYVFGERAFITGTLTWDGEGYPASIVDPETPLPAELRPLVDTPVTLLPEFLDSSSIYAGRAYPTVVTATGEWNFVPPAADSPEVIIAEEPAYLMMETMWSTLEI